MLLWLLAVGAVAVGLPAAVFIVLFVIGSALILSTKYGGAGAAGAAE
jgi:hypothetical protein